MSRRRTSTKLDPNATVHITVRGYALLELAELYRLLALRDVLEQRCADYEDATTRITYQEKTP